MTNEVNQASGHATIQIGVSATARMRINLALHHLFAACRLTARIGTLERANEGQSFGAFWEEILQDALGVAALTVAALESYANELYFEGSIPGADLPAEATAKIAKLVDKEPVLEKFAIALAVKAGKRLATGESPTQDVAMLIKLRNAVVHFRPAWMGESPEHDKLSAQLAHRFESSPFLLGEGSFPRAWASASFGQWAVQSTIEFLDYFYREAGLPSPLDLFRDRIAELRAGAQPA